MIDTLNEWSTNYFGFSCVLAALAGFFADFVYAKYMQAVADRRPLAACNWSLVYTCIALLLIAALIGQSIWHILCYLAGGYYGTWHGTRNK